jgi:anti-sigma B factor antagonist
MAMPQYQSADPVTVVQTGPQLTMDTAHELLRLIRSMPSGTSPLVVVDMKETRVVDSTGVGALVSSMRYLRQLRGGFALSRLNPELHHVFQLMNLHQVLTVCDSVEHASEHLLTRPTPEF